MFDCSSKRKVDRNMFSNNNSGNEFELYNGLTDPTHFFRRFDLQALYSEWKTTDLVTILKFFLKGKAEEIYNELQSAS